MPDRNQLKINENSPSSDSNVRPEEEGIKTNRSIGVKPTVRFKRPP